MSGHLRDVGKHNRLENVAPRTNGPDGGEIRPKMTAVFANGVTRAANGFLTEKYIAPASHIASRQQWS